MKLTRGKRIALELLGPPALGAAPFLIAFVSSAKSVKQGFTAAGYILLIAYAVVGIQSILFSAIMEWRFKRGLDPRSWQMVRLSSFLGFGSGAVVSLANMDQSAKMWTTFLVMGGLGLLVGFLMGLLIKYWSTEKKTTGESAP